MKDFKISLAVAAVLTVALIAGAVGGAELSPAPQEETVQTTAQAAVLHQVHKKPIEKKPQVSCQEETEEKEGVPCKLPDVKSDVKYFTDYRSYNLWYTPHYRLQQAAWTDEQGFRRYGEDYIVALGSFYSTRIGDRFKVTLDTGRSFTVIFGDGKWNEDCDELCMYTPCTDYDGEASANLLEFIVDEEVLDSEVYEYGDVSMISGFEGSVAEMRYLGRDVAEDWDTYEVIK